MGFDFGRIAERKIEEAIAEGRFDDIPGKGQPLNLEEDATIPAHLRVANNILKNAGVLPDWMQVDSEIDDARRECASAWSRIEKEYPKRRLLIQAAAAEKGRDAAAKVARREREFAEWHARNRAAYVALLKRVNTEITKVNMMAPSVSRVHIPFKVAEETERFDAAFAPLPGVEVSVEEPARERRAGADLRDAAAGLYRNGGRGR